jgi:hypothetical protein
LYFFKIKSIIHVLIIITTLFTYSCEQIEGPVNFTVDMSISVISKQNGSDLLDPNNPKKLDISQIRIFYPPSTQTNFVEPKARDGQPYIYAADGKYYIRFYPASNSTKHGDVPKILFTWPDRSEDLVEASILKKEQHTFVFNMYLNDSLVWNADIEKRNIIKRPSRSITVMK